MPFGVGKLSVMKTFTLRQVRGKASLVLDVCDRDGRVQITRTAGKRYLLERVKTRTGAAPSCAQSTLIHPRGEAQKSGLQEKALRAMRRRK